MEKFRRTCMKNPAGRARGSRVSNPFLLLSSAFPPPSFPPFSSSDWPGHSLSSPYSPALSFSLPKLSSSSSGWAISAQPVSLFFLISVATHAHTQHPYLFLFSFFSILTFHLNFPLIWAIQMAHQIFIIKFIKCQTSNFNNFFVITPNFEPSAPTRP